MKELFTAFGPYNLRARLSVGIILIAPWILELYLLISEMQKITSTLIVLLITYGFCNLLIIYCRIPGTRAMKKCFPDLLPAQKALLPSSNYIDPKSKDRYYTFLSQNIKEFTLSDDDTHMKNSVSTAVTWLIAQTRSPTKVPLIAEENINFGFSYNLLGLKPLGLAMCFIGIVFNAALFFLSHKQFISLNLTNIVCGFIINLAFLLIWIFLINKKLVISSGKKYARALLSACDSLNAN